jgi:TRAP-type C4-dicarboxylate transport system substrate-binding protein
MTLRLSRNLIVGAVASAALYAGVATAQTYTMKIGMVTINDPQFMLAKKYKEEIEKRTGGKIRVKIFPVAQLGKIPRQIEGLRLGTQEGFVSPPGFMAGLAPGFAAPDAPGVYKNFWHAHNAFTSPAFRNAFLRQAESRGIIGVSIFNYGPTSIASLKPIRKLSDLKGMKVRVLATKMESKLADTLGMTGVPMPFSEVLPALQRKTLDGCRSSIVVMGALKFFSVTKSITLIESGTIPSGLWVSKRWLNKLPKNLQKAVVETGRDIEAWAGHMSWGFNQRAQALWKKNGAEIIRLSASDQAKVNAMLKPLGDEFLGKNPKTSKMYGMLKAALATASDKPTPMKK